MRVGEEKCLEGLNGAVAREGARVEVVAVVVYACEVAGEGGAVVRGLVEGEAPSVDKVAHIVQCQRGDAGVVDMDVYNEEPGRCRHVEDAVVVDALLKAVGEEKNIVAALPYNAGVTAPGHVAGDENEVAGTVGAVGWEVAKFGQPGRNEGKDEAATVFGGNGSAVVVGLLVLLS